MASSSPIRRIHWLPGAVANAQSCRRIRTGDDGTRSVPDAFPRGAWERAVAGEVTGERPGGAAPQCGAASRVTAGLCVFSFPRSSVGMPCGRSASGSGNGRGAPALAPTRERGSQREYSRRSRRSRGPERRHLAGPPPQGGELVPRVAHNLLAAKDSDGASRRGRQDAGAPKVSAAVAIGGRPRIRAQSRGVTAIK